MSDQSSQLDWFLKSPVYAGVPKELRLAGATGVGMIRVDQPPGVFQRAGSDEFCLNLLFTDGAVARVDHGVRFDCRSEAGGFALTPCDVDLGYEMQGGLSFLATIIPRRVVRAAIEARTGRPWRGDFGPLHGQVFQNGAARALLLQLWEEAASGSPWGPLFAESAMQTLALALASATGQPLDPPPARGGLSPSQTRRICEYLQEHFDEEPSLADLAALIDRSPWHFVRAFKASTGLPPHRYLVTLRVERAKEMLAGTDKSITEIAHACGFASSQHMATLFRRAVGTTPTEYRRQRCC